ncbi:MAG: two-component system, cell cycle response regulator [Solirubrobacteraceae bacterium]|jgi:two-component system cell cycle response regulator|nr:two-component system, cell cycle response regulator [Solirubrobacteraceae bacterium]
MRVVLAHGDAPRRRQLGGILARVGHVVAEAETAEEAVAVCQDSPTDVAVVDVDLCRTSTGKALLHAIKGDVDAFRTAVVLLERAALDLEVAVSALHQGVQDFLVEPISEGELVTRIAAAARTKVLQEELVEQSRRLETLIFEDPLTGLANRRFILTQLGSLVSGTRRHGRPLSIAIIDIDHFKAVNDEHGHQTGDHVLVAVTGALRHHMRAEDHLGRLGGEEFLAVLPDSDRDAAAAAAERMRGEVAATAIEHEGVPLGVTVSLGVATWEPDEPPERLLRRADDALYSAKGAGRDLVVSARASVPRRT